MPLGFERLNERTKRPNEHINFIRPLPGRDEALSRDFLERVAAVCYPVMKAHHIYVMALEEHAPNQEFVGRNFNAGEVVQLVLRAPRSGQWLPFRHVQMVMMHELAHCKQMNHSKAFWKVRDQYAGELRELWGRRYTGEGLWGRGQTLLSGQYETDVMPDAVQGVDRLCGGTYRSGGRGGRKRKRGKENTRELSYAERKQRRILKKFGAGGVALGDDEATRTQLEAGRRPTGKPRVAGSARGRELRAAAALARFEQVKAEGVAVNIKQEDTDSETESEDEGYATAEQAIDTNGERMTDRKGRPLVSVCGAEDPNDGDVQREMRELYDYGFTIQRPDSDAKRSSGPEPKPGHVEGEPAAASKQHDRAGMTQTAPSDPNVTASESRRIPSPRPPSAPAGETPSPVPSSGVPPLICEICSLENAPGALVCAACSHVQRPDAMPNSWRCQRACCAGTAYLNSGDAGRCGICGASSKDSLLP